MKKIVIGLFVYLFICLFSKQSLAASLTLTNSISQQINNLQERIATRVAQLKLVDHRGIIGTVTDVTQTQIALADIQGNTRFIDVDEITKFSNPSAKGTFGISDIKKGQT